MRIFLLVTLFFSLCIADAITIDGNITHIESAKYQIVVEDEHKNLSAQEILDKNISKPYAKLNTGYSQSAFWSVFGLKNSADSNVAMIFRNQKAGADKIDVYIFDKNKKLLQTHTLGDMRDQSLRLLSSTNSSFYLILPPKEEVTVVTRFESLGPLYLAWDIYGTQEYGRLNSWNLLFFGVFGGIVLALIIYNLNMFINLKEISFVWYILHALSITWFQYAFGGVFYFMDLGIDLYFLTVSAVIAPCLFLVFFLLFVTNIFGLYEKKRKLFIYFMALATVNFTIAILLFFGLYGDMEWGQFFYIHVVWVITMISIAIFLIYAFWKGFPYAWYFLVGEGTYALVATTLLFISMKTDIWRGIEFYALPMGMLWEIVFSSMALSKRVGEIKQNNELKDRLIAEEAKFTSIGKSIGNITHQWKEPINRLSGYMTYIQALRYNKDDKKLIEELDETIEKSANIIDYMKGSVDELYSFYSGNKDDVVNVKKKIDLAYKLQQDRLIPKGISVDIECKDDIYIYGGKHALANTLMILFDNAIDQFLDNKQKNKKIKVTVRTDEDSISIDFYDNAGGVKIKPIQKVFEANISTKGELGSGIGLSIAKKLIEERMEGKISVQNVEKGAMFRLEIPRA